MLRFAGYPPSELLYLSRDDVIECFGAIDPVGVTEDALRQHAAGATLLPDEAYLGWQTAAGDAARSLAMPGGFLTPDGPALGLKVINGCLGNPGRGLARAQGLLMLFDAESAWPGVLMESAYISALRTAAVTALTTAQLGPKPVTRLAVLGCGTLALAHLILLPPVLGDLTQIALYDMQRSRAEAMARDLRADPDTRHLRIEVASEPRECVSGADIVVTVTTTTKGYLRYAWLKPGALIAHVSLDDVLPEVVTGADLVVVDDWGLVSHDDRRLLGRMYREGLLLGPGGEHPADVMPAPGAARVHATIGDVLAGRHPRRRDEDIVLSNPFGMSILDVALGHAVARAAEKRQLGRRIPR